MSRSLTVKEKYPSNSRPRERLMNLGPEVLSDHELLAILLKTGSQKKNALDLALEILTALGDLYALKQVTLEELMTFSGIGPVKACEILAVIELGQRIHHSRQVKKGPITSTAAAGQFFMSVLSDRQQEHVLAAFLNTKNEIIRSEIIFKGSLSSSVAHPREIFKAAVRYSAARILLGHNHPSGNPEPSEADYAFTRRMVDCGEMMGIEILDHLIIGDQNFISLREKGAI